MTYDGQETRTRRSLPLDITGRVSGDIVKLKVPLRERNLWDLDGSGSLPTNGPKDEWVHYFGITDSEGRAGHNLFVLHSEVTTRGTATALPKSTV